MVIEKLIESKGTGINVSFHEPVTGTDVLQQMVKVIRNYFPGLFSAMNQVEDLLHKKTYPFYLAAPEVDNYRRALNTFHGMRRAKKKVVIWAWHSCYIEYCLLVYVIVYSLAS